MHHQQQGGPRGGPASYNPSHNAYHPPPQQQQQQPQPPQQQYSSTPVNVFNPAAFKAGPRPQQGAAPGAGPSQQHGGYGGGGGAYPGGGGEQPMDFGLDAITAAANSQVFTDNCAFTMGMGMGQEYLSANVKRYIPWFTAFWQGLKYYFSVNHYYVRRKLATLVFPFRKRQWRREIKDDGMNGDTSKHHYQTPMLDENAPDLYIPLMAFITYILVTGYAKGTKNSFTPEVLVEVTTSCLVMQILEIALIRFGLYLLAAPANLMDLLAVTGYKYVALNINMILGLSFGQWSYSIALVYTGTALAYFSLKTFAQAVRLAGPRDLSSAPVRVELMVLGFSLLQFFSVWWLGYSKTLL